MKIDYQKLQEEYSKAIDEKEEMGHNIYLDMRDAFLLIWYHFFNPTREYFFLKSVVNGMHLDFAMKDTKTKPKNYIIDSLNIWFGDGL